MRRLSNVWRYYGPKALKGIEPNPVNSPPGICPETRAPHHCRQRGSVAQASNISIPVVACTSARAAAIKTVLITHNLH